MHFFEIIPIGPEYLRLDQGAFRFGVFSLIVNTDKKEKKSIVNQSLGIGTGIEI